MRPKCLAVSASVLLIVGTSGRAADLDMRTIPIAPDSDYCVGINTNMPPTYASAARDINRKYLDQANEADAIFEKQTGEIGRLWKKEHGATVDRYVHALSRANYPKAPYSADRVATWDEQHKFEILVARWKLETVKIKNRENEEEAEELLRFAERGGNTIAVDNLLKTIDEILAACKKDGAAVYQAWWDSEKK
jgi:hypothetical protein